MKVEANVCIIDTENDLDWHVRVAADVSVDADDNPRWDDFQVLQACPGQAPDAESWARMEFAYWTDHVWHLFRRASWQRHQAEDALIQEYEVIQQERRIEALEAQVRQARQELESLRRGRIELVSRAPLKVVR